MKEACCGSCRFFYCYKQRDEYDGYCARYPPTNVRETGKNADGYWESHWYSSWPEVDVDSWCGEYQRSDAKCEGGG